MNQEALSGVPVPEVQKNGWENFSHTTFTEGEAATFFEGTLGYKVDPYQEPHQRTGKEWWNISANVYFEQSPQPVFILDDSNNVFCRSSAEDPSDKDDYLLYLDFRAPHYAGKKDIFEQLMFKLKSLGLIELNEGELDDLPVGAVYFNNVSEFRAAAPYIKLILNYTNYY